MSQHTVTDQPHWRQYALLFLDLHRLVAAGKGDTTEADQLRDEMDIHWPELSTEELERVNGLAADLCSLGRDPPDSAISSTATADKFQEAVRASDWDLALWILREHEPELTAADAACLRGICWAKLHQYDVAVLFFAEAARLHPDDIRFKSLFWRALIRADRGEEAKEFAQRALNSSTNPYETALAAGVLFDWAADQPDEQADPVFRQIAETVTR